VIPIPDSKEDLTPEWFTSILGVTGNNQVESVDLLLLGEKDSVSGYVYRANLTYFHEIQDKPVSVIVKLPKPRGLRTQSLRSAYEREVKFYQVFAPQIGVPVPKLIHSDYDGKYSDYVLVIEDFPDAVTASNQTGASPEQAYSLLGYMAKLHAQYWSDNKLLECSFLNRVESSIKRFNDGFPERLPLFLSRFGEIIEPEELTVFKAFPKSFLKSVEPLLEAPYTLIHNDFAIKNILIRVNAQEASTFVLLDWAIVGRGPGVRDVSFFIETSIPPAMRSEYEEMFLRHYWRELCSGGVSGYSFDRLMEDYRRSVLVDLARISWTGGQEPMVVFESIVRHNLRGRTGSARELDLYSLFNH
jgi:aminoglycoside phosphotransferase (APT) family kinase protein